MAFSFLVEGETYAVDDRTAIAYLRGLREISAREPDEWMRAGADGSAVKIERALGSIEEDSIELTLTDADALLHVLDLDEERYRNPDALHRAVRRWLGHPEHPEHPEHD